MVCFMTNNRKRCRMLQFLGYNVCKLIWPNIQTVLWGFMRLCSHFLAFPRKWVYSMSSSVIEMRYVSRDRKEIESLRHSLEINGYEGRVFLKSYLRFRFPTYYVWSYLRHVLLCPFFLLYLTSSLFLSTVSSINSHIFGTLFLFSQGICILLLDLFS